MRRTSKTLESDLELQIDAAPMRAVTTDFAYTSIVAEPSAGTTTAFHGHLDGVLAGIGDAVFEQVNENDFIAGTDAADMLFGNAGNDLITGGAGDDVLDGGEGNDTLVGQEGNDTLLGGGGMDWLIGDAGNDHLIGGDGDDTLEGRAGDDRLEGGAGNDILKGGDGNDVLVAGSGYDIMIGGAGRDVFVVQPASPYQYTPVDRIADFQTALTAGYYPQRDVIDLGEALKSSTFSGTIAVEAVQLGVIYLVQHGTPGEEGFGTTVYMDRNGHAPDYGYNVDVPLVVLDGVAANSLHVAYYNGNFIV